jgi:predicted Rossmann fold nucleotide-binding protein DprA/Smf involved in DNA uptake
MKQRIAMIGTRELHEMDQDIVACYGYLAEVVSRLGHVVVSGLATGFDQRAMSIAAGNRGDIIAVSPWASYEREFLKTIQDMTRVTVLTYNAARFPEWKQSVARYHPKPGALTRGAFALHARNYGIIDNADAVIAVPSPQGGGTMQGVRIATELGKPLFNLTDVDQRTTAMKYIEGLGHAG